MSPDWRAFSFETGHYVLHVPTSTVVEADAGLADHVRGVAETREHAATLAELLADLPTPAVREIKPDISVVSLNMAQGCNLRCTYCFAGEGDYGVKAMMSFATATKVVETLSAGKRRFTIIFFGGEPMLNYTVIQQVVAWCEQRPECEYSYAMTTNGTLLNAERLAWLKEKKFRLTMSYDGKGLQAKQRLNKDKVSNSESLVERKLEAFAEQLRQLQDFTLRATITKPNIPLLEEALVNTLTSKNYRTIVAHHATPLRAMYFGPDDVAELGRILTRVIDRFLAAGQYEKVLQLDFVKTGIRRIHHGYTGQMACGAGIHYLTVSAEGGYYLCHRFNEDESERVGGVETGVDQAKLQQIADFRAKRLAPCGTCWMREWCAGGCFHEHKAANGDKFAIDPMYCKLQALEIEQAMRVYTVLLQKAPHLLDA